MRVPLVIVSGFLGAGKTTLINRLLARRAGQGAGGAGKLGIVVNELGAIGIDGALLGGKGARQIELPGGCVCCVLGDQLDQTLIELVDGTRPPDHLDAIVLETTGVAEPLGIAWALQRDPVASRVRLAAVVTLVDAANFRTSLPLTVAVAAQVAYADVLLVTKPAIAGDAETEAAIAAARSLAPRALIRTGSTDEHAAWLEAILVDPDLERAPDTTADRAAHAAALQGGHGHDHDHHGASHGGDAGHCRQPDSHAHGIDSIWLEIPGLLDLEELEDQLADLPPNYVRIKGIAHAVDGRRGDSVPHWFAFHRVGLRVSSEPLVRKPDEFPEDRGRIVALGHELETERVAACVAASRIT